MVYIAIFQHFIRGIKCEFLTALSTITQLLQSLISNVPELELKVDQIQCEKCSHFRIVRNFAHKHWPEVRFYYLF